MKRVYPYANQLSFSGSVQDTSTICFTQTVENLETIQAIPIAMGLHPYFIIPQGQARPKDLRHVPNPQRNNLSKIAHTLQLLIPPRTERGNMRFWPGFSKNGHFFFEELAMLP